MTPSLKAALRIRYAPPEWALFYEVGDATGGRARRWADAVAMNLYPSRGLIISGFEVKAYRGDWLKELKTPDKSAPVQQYCNHWWIVAAPDIVKLDELPVTWGLMELKSNGLRVMKPAPSLQPQPVTKDFVAAMLRRASEVDHAEVRKLVDKEVAEARRTIEREVEQKVAYRTRDWEKVQKTVAEIKEHCGIDLIHNWEDTKQLARAFKLARDSGLVNHYGGLAALATALEKSAANVRNALAAFQDPEHAAEQQEAA